MEFDEIMKIRATHKLHHATEGGVGDNLSDLSCQTCYPTQNIIKHERFDRFWEMIEQMDMGIEAYSGQTIYAFNKLTELSFEKGKPHNASLVAGIRAILTTMEYAEKPKVDMMAATYQIGIMLKKSKMFTTEHTDQQLLEEVAVANRDREEKKRSPSPTQYFGNMFKRRDSVASDTSSLAAADLSIKRSRSQYQALTFQKQPFETSDLSQHPIKNLQSTINVLTDQEDNDAAETGDAQDISQQRKPEGHSFPSGSSKPDKKGKGKDTGDQSSLRNIPPASGGGGDDDDSSSDEEPDQRKPWHPKPRRKIPVSQGNTVQEQNENRERLVAEWMIKGQAKRGKPITTPKAFSGKVGEDPTSFLENLIVDAEANSWDETDLLEVISGFLKDDAREWFIDNRHRIQHWDEVTD